MTDYNDGNWHEWKGGECPVHPQTVVQVSFNQYELSGGHGRNYFAEELNWDYETIFHAFRVLLPYRGNSGMERTPAMSDDLVSAAEATECFWCGRRPLSTFENGGPECEMFHGEWVCSRECYDSALTDARLNTLEAAVGQREMQIAALDAYAASEPSRMTLQEMYQDLRARGHLGDGQPPRRAERAVLWPWAVTSLNTTLVESAASAPATLLNNPGKDNSHE